MQNTFVSTTWSKHIRNELSPMQLQTLHKHGTCRHIWMVYREPIISVTQHSKTQEPNFGGT